MKRILEASAVLALCVLPFVCVLYLLGTVGALEHGAKITEILKALPALFALCCWGAVVKNISEQTNGRTGGRTDEHRTA